MEYDIEQIKRAITQFNDSWDSTSKVKLRLGDLGTACPTFDVYIEFDNDPFASCKYSEGGGAYVYFSDLFYKTIEKFIKKQLPELELSWNSCKDIGILSRR